jgi:hypothetical protein
MLEEWMKSAYARPIPAVLIAWFLSLGVDLFLHGGLLARLYLIKSPFILPADQAFRRIPLGYLAFLLLTAALFWLCRRLDVRGIRAGWWHGFVFGLVLWGSLVLGLYSISTASVPLLFAWWLGQAVELGISGGVIGGLAAGISPRRMLFWVTLIVVGLLVLTITLQSLGVAPPMHTDHARAAKRLCTPGACRKREQARAAQEMNTHSPCSFVSGHVQRVARLADAEN